LRPDLRLGALTASLPLHGARFAEELGAWSLNCDVDFVDAGLVADAHSRGLKILVYTVDELSDGDTLAAMGVDGIFTNRPDRFS
ncbi:MAG: glycerophosphodiester phosphodiesterase, partial [Aeromonas sp.]|nr:glycerophosphodiester phosphodiesterase [Aeromonas sp.]